MELYTVQLGKAGVDGFRLIETSKIGASNLNAAQDRMVSLLKTRGVQIGANRAQLLDQRDNLLREFP